MRGAAAVGAEVFSVDGREGVFVVDEVAVRSRGSGINQLQVGSIVSLSAGWHVDVALGAVVTPYQDVVAQFDVLGEAVGRGVGEVQYGRKLGAGAGHVVVVQSDVRNTVELDDLPAVRLTDVTTQGEFLQFVGGALVVLGD